MSGCPQSEPPTFTMPPFWAGIETHDLRATTDGPTEKSMHFETKHYVLTSSLLLTCPFPILLALVILAVPVLLVTFPRVLDSLTPQFGALDEAIKPVLPPITSARRLMSPHQTSFPLLSFMSVSLSTSSIVAYTILLPRMAIIVAVEGEAARLPREVWACGVPCSSRNCMHRSASRAARVRSSGEGTPPWRVWPREADRASNRSLPSSLRILVSVSVL